MMNPFQQLDHRLRKTTAWSLEDHPAREQNIDEKDDWLAAEIYEFITPQRAGVSPSIREYRFRPQSTKPDGQYETSQWFGALPRVCREINNVNVADSDMPFKTWVRRRSLTNGTPIWEFEYKTTVVEPPDFYIGPINGHGDIQPNTITEVSRIVNLPQGWYHFSINGLFLFPGAGILPDQRVTAYFYLNDQIFYLPTFDNNAPFIFENEGFSAAFFYHHFQTGDVILRFFLRYYVGFFPTTMAVDSPLHWGLHRVKKVN